MNNPYSAPISSLQEEEDYENLSTYQPKFFAWNGRLNRLRYFVYNIGAVSIGIIIAAIVAFAYFSLLGTQNLGSSSEKLLEFILIIPITAATLVISRRRLHDLGWSGWLCLIGLLPYISGIFGLILLCKKGDEGRNEYGPAPAPNSIGAWLVVVVTPLVILLGFMIYSVYARLSHHLPPH